MAFRAFTLVDDSSRGSGATSAPRGTPHRRYPANTGCGGCHDLGQAQPGRRGLQTPGRREAIPILERARRRCWQPSCTANRIPTRGLATRRPGRVSATRGSQRWTRTTATSPKTIAQRDVGGRTGDHEPGFRGSCSRSEPFSGRSALSRTRTVGLVLRKSSCGLWRFTDARGCGIADDSGHDHDRDRRSVDGGLRHEVDVNGQRMIVTDEPNAAVAPTLSRRPNFLGARSRAGDDGALQRASRCPELVDGDGPLPPIDRLNHGRRYPAACRSARNSRSAAGPSLSLVRRQWHSRRSWMLHLGTFDIGEGVSWRRSNMT